MKIDQYHNNYIQKMTKTSGDHKAGAVDGKTSSQSTVEISTQAKALVKRISQSEDSQISEKVENIRKQLQEGTYQVDTQKIADKILGELDGERMDVHE